MNQHPLHKLKVEQDRPVQMPVGVEPSASVWQGIQQKLPVKRKKRPVVLLWLFVVIGFASAILLYWPSKSQTMHAGQLADLQMNKPSAKATEGNVQNPGYVNPKLTALSDTSDNFIAIKSASSKLARFKHADPKRDFSLLHGASFQNYTVDKKNNLLAIDEKSAEPPGDSEVPYHGSIDNVNKSQPLPEDNPNAIETVWLAPNLNAEMMGFTDYTPMPKLHLINTRSSKQHQYWLGFGFNKALSGENKNFVSTDPLSELVSGSYYRSAQRWVVNFYLPFSQKWSFHAKPAYASERLITDYDLNIPYDFNSEIHFGIYNENYFKHSLPTDQGNISTQLVVTRSADSPVMHNELISLDFRSRQNLAYLSFPVGVTYGHIMNESGWLASLSWVPEILITRSVEVEFIHSNHSYVSPKSVSLTKERSTGSLHNGAALDLGYKFALGNNWSILLQGGYTHYFSQSGRNQLWSSQFSIGKEF
jgi:hypothetical protein